MTWKFWIDRGGTFTDVVAQAEDGQFLTLKLLSENEDQQVDAALLGIRRVLKLSADELIPTTMIDEVKMGTTVATNALLERRGQPTTLCITEGFKDQLQIAYQNRPDIFARNIILPKMLYNNSVEISERMDQHGTVLVKLNSDKVTQQLTELYQKGVRSIAVVFMHGYQYPEHELLVGDIAKRIGFTQVSLSHQVSAIQKIVSRGHTTVVDAYLSPIIHHYVAKMTKELNDTPLYFMQSSGGLSEAHHFRGKNSIFSGPAAGVVGAATISQQAGFDKIISFDMGGTSTDVALFDGHYQRRFETIFDGIPIHAPMMHIHTVAAGGGSILHFKQGRYQVGPDSAGANPGPACYRRNGPLTITDCKVILGRIQAEFFPSVFGKDSNQPLEHKLVHQQFIELTDKINKESNTTQTPEQVAQDFLTIAIHNMVNAIKKISLQRGYDVSEYTLCSFGGAGGQHACQIAELLGIPNILVPANAGVLSAIGMGMADLRMLKEQSVGSKLSASSLSKITDVLDELAKQGQQELIKQSHDKLTIKIEKTLRLKYLGTDVPLEVPLASIHEMQETFVRHFQQQ